MLEPGRERGVALVSGAPEPELAERDPDALAELRALAAGHEAGDLLAGGRDQLGVGVEVVAEQIDQRERQRGVLGGQRAGQRGAGADASEVWIRHGRLVTFTVAVWSFATVIATS